MRVARACIYLCNILELFGREIDFYDCLVFFIKWWKVVHVTELVFFIVKIFIEQLNRHKGEFIGENISGIVEDFLFPI